MLNLDDLDIKKGLNSFKCPHCGSTIFDEDDNCLYCYIKNEALIEIKTKVAAALQEYHYEGLTPNILLLYINREQINMPELNTFLNNNHIAENVERLKDELSNKIKKGEKLTSEEEACLITFIENNELKELFDIIIFLAISKLKIISVKVLRAVIIKTVENNMRTLYQKYNNKEYQALKPLCIIKKMEGDTLGITIGLDNILLSDDNIDLLAEGDVTPLFTIFHELYHINQNLDIDAGFINEDIILKLKERVVRSVFGDNYYLTNHDKISFEIDAEIFSYVMTFNYLESLGIPPTDEMRKKTATLIANKLKEKCNTVRDTSKVPEINDNALYLEELFLIAINRIPEGLEKIKQLQVLYVLDNGRVRPKTIQELQDELELYDEMYKKYISGFIAKSIGNQVKRES